MENNIIRKSSILGKITNILGNTKADLILESLGKIYVKTGNNTRLLNDVFKLLDLTNNTSFNKIIITDKIETLKFPGDGFLIFDSTKKALYISYDNRYLLIIDSLLYESSNYVKKTGDTMTGPLVIKTKNAPLIVASKQLVENLNAELLNGFTSDYFTNKKLELFIYSKWTFDSTVSFNDGVKVKNTSELENVNILDNLNVKNKIIVGESIGSINFLNGQNGFGWRIDSKTNSLIIDYLIVRKAMLVFELIVNQIKATNGSLWITDSCEIDKVETIKFIKVEKDKFPKLLKDTWYLPYIIFGNDFNTKYVTINNENINIGLDDTVSFVTYNYIFKLNELLNLELLNLLENDLTYFEIPSKLNSLIDCTIIHCFPENLANLTEETSKLKEIESIKEQTITGNITIDKIKEQLNNIDFSAPDLLSKIQLFINSMYTLDTTPIFLSTDLKLHIKSYDEIHPIFNYYKYYGDKSNNYIFKQLDQLVTTIPLTHPNLFIITMDNKNYPSFKLNDLIRCQKFENNNIRYYDAVVVAEIDSYTYLIQKALDNFDKYTEIRYSETNIPVFKDYYNILQDNPLNQLAEIKPKDGLIRIGNLNKPDRQNSVFITSSEHDSPFIQTMSGVNRPDYSVIYSYPNYIIKRINNKFYYKYEISAVDYSESNPLHEKILENNIYKYYEYRLDFKWKSAIIEKENGVYLCKFNNVIKTRFGNLQGVYNEKFKDSQPYGYGLYGENVFLTGEFYLNNGKSVIEFAKDQIKIGILDSNKKLLETGIDIENRKITVIADRFLIKSNDPNAPKEIAAFIYNPETKQIQLNTGDINADNLKAKNVEIEGLIKANQGYFSGYIKHTPTIITPQNLVEKNYGKIENGILLLNYERTGSFIEFTGFSKEWIDKYNIHSFQINLPEDTTERLSLLGNTLIIKNSTYGSSEYPVLLQIDIAKTDPNTDTIVSIKSNRIGVSSTTFVLDNKSNGNVKWLFLIAKIDPLNPINK